MKVDISKLTRADVGRSIWAKGEIFSQSKPIAETDDIGQSEWRVVWVSKSSMVGIVDLSWATIEDHGMGMTYHGELSATSPRGGFFETETESLLAEIADEEVFVASHAAEIEEAKRCFAELKNRG